MTRNHPPGGTAKQGGLLYFGASRRQNDRIDCDSYTLICIGRHQSTADYGGDAGYRTVRTLMIYPEIPPLQVTAELGYTQQPIIWPYHR
jgi:hypothetical protein